MPSPSSAIRHAVAPVMDRLDARRLLAFSTINSGGTLSVTGDSRANVITVELSGGFILAKRNGVTEKHTASKVKRLWANGLGGNDSITIKVALPATLLGESGNDTLIGGSKADSIDGGSGNDQISGLGGDDTLIGGLNNDTVRGGEGNDHVYGDDLTGGDGTSATGRDSLYGDNGNDTFYNGSDGADRYEGGAGNDRFEQIPDADAFADGADTFIGGSGTDSISYHDREQPLRITLDNIANDGGAGENDDVRSDVENVFGGNEPDYIVGSSANNLLEGGVVFFGPDTVIGGAGNDTLYGGILDGGLGNDVMDGGIYTYSARTKPLRFTFDENQNAYRGGEAGENDTFVFSLFYENELVLGSGHDRVTNARGFVIRGGAGNDTLSGVIDDNFGLGSEFYGDAGNDLLTTTSYAFIEGGTGNDTMWTQDRDDSTLSFGYATSSVRISYDGNNANDGPVNERDVIKIDSFGAVLGGRGNDVFVGDNKPNYFDGKAGNDLLIGRAGDDTLDGNTGADTLNGGLGDDAFVGGNDRDADTVDYSDRTEDLTININVDSAGNGAVGEDDLFAGDIEVVIGGSGDDDITGNPRDNTLRGGGGNDTLRGEAGRDSLVGDAGNDQLLGGTENDTLRGGTGTDFLSGDKGSDQLFGDADNDIIFAQDKLVDLVDGGQGTDTATYDSGSIVDQLISIERKL